MSTENYYFQHNCNARNNAKLIAVRMRHKAEGYGVYFMILEKLMEASEHLLVKDYNIIAFDLRVSAELVKSIVEDFGLFSFTEDKKFFFSEGFNQRMKPFNELREKKRLAGIKSGESRRNKENLAGNDERNPNSVGTKPEHCSNTSRTNDEHCSNKNEHLLSKRKERKGKEIEGNETREEKIEETTSDEVAKKDPIDYKSITDLFNSLLRGHLPEVKNLSPRRKTMIRIIVDTYGRDKLEEAFRQVLRSPFLLGRNEDGWKCNFDWILKGSNFVKVLEGNYLTNTNQTPFKHPFTERINTRVYEEF